MRRSLRVVLWVARISGAAIVGLMVCIGIVGALKNPPEPGPTAAEWIRLAFFPIGVCLGYVVAWRWHLLGGFVSVACLAAFFIAHAVRGNVLYDDPGFYVFVVPSALFIVYGFAFGRLPAAAACN